MPHTTTAPSAASVGQKDRTPRETAVRSASIGRRDTPFEPCDTAWRVVRSPASGSGGTDPAANGYARRTLRRSIMPLGPVELLEVKFPGNQFKGEIVPALKELVENG